MDDVFVVLASCGPIIGADSDITDVLNVSLSEEAAWESIEKDINDLFTKNNFGHPLHIGIHPELKFVRVGAPICCGCDDTNVIYTHHDYKILKRKMIN